MLNFCHWITCQIRPFFDQLKTYNSHPHPPPLTSSFLPPTFFLLVFFHKFNFELFCFFNHVSSPFCITPFCSAIVNVTHQNSLLVSHAVTHSLSKLHLLPSASPASSFLGDLGNSENSEIPYNTRVCPGTGQRKNKRHRQEKEKGKLL